MQYASSIQRLSGLLEKEEQLNDAALAGAICPKQASDEPKANRARRSPRLEIRELKAANRGHVILLSEQNLPHVRVRRRRLLPGMLASHSGSGDVANGVELVRSRAHPLPARAAIAAATFLFLLSGCGGSDRLSRDDYAKKADAVCAKYNRRIQALRQPRTVSGISAFTAEAIPIARRGDDELRTLEPPQGDEETAKRWLAANEEVVAAITRLGTAARRGDRAGIRKALREGTRANGRAKRLARKLGLRVCARG
jgi:hypothetical protein